MLKEKRVSVVKQKPGRKQVQSILNICKMWENAIVKRRKNLCEGQWVQLSSLSVIRRLLPYYIISIPGPKIILWNGCLCMSLLKPVLIQL